MLIHKRIMKCVLCFICLGTTYNIINIYRPRIPFEYISEHISWRDYSTQYMYKQINITRFKSYIKHRLNIEGYFILKNDFPYNLEYGIGHYILWVKYNNKVNVPDVIHQRFDINKYNIKYFENPLRKRSISDIQHYQIFVKEII